MLSSGKVFLVLWDWAFHNEASVFSLTLSYFMRRQNSKTFQKENVSISKENSKRLNAKSSRNNSNSYCMWLSPRAGWTSLFWNAHLMISHVVRSLNQSALHCRKPRCREETSGRCTLISKTTVLTPSCWDNSADAFKVHLQFHQASLRKARAF